MTRRPSRGVWAAWTLALVGGLTVLAAVVLVLNDPCVDADEAVRTTTCNGSNLGPVTAMVAAGTAAAVVGGMAATVLTLRQRPSDA